MAVERPKGEKMRMDAWMMGVGGDEFGVVGLLAMQDGGVLGAPAAGGAGGEAGGGAAGAGEGAGIEGEAVPGGEAAQTGPGGLGWVLPGMAALMIFMLVTSTMSGRKEKKKREAMLSGMKRGDTVQTIGGIIGTVAEIKDDRVLLRVDPSGSTRIAFTRASVQAVLKSSGGGGENASAEAGAGEPDGAAVGAGA